MRKITPFVGNTPYFRLLKAICQTNNLNPQIFIELISILRKINAKISLILK